MNLEYRKYRQPLRKVDRFVTPVLLPEDYSIPGPDLHTMSVSFHVKPYVSHFS